MPELPVRQPAATNAPDTGLSDPQEIADAILTEGRVSEFVSEYNGREYVDTDLVELEYDVGGRKSKKVKKLLEREAGL